jgi:transposase
MLCGIMDDSSQRAQLAKLIKLNEELARTNAKQASEIEALVDAAQTIREDRDRLAENQREQRQRIEELEAINKQLTNMLWGRRSERRSFDPNQTRLFPDEPRGEEPSGITADDLAQETIDEELIKQWQRRLEQQRKKRASRRTEAFPDHFERRERVLDLDDEDKVGLKYIGDAITERMRFERPHVYIERIVRRKYVTDGQPEQGVKVAPADLAIVEGCRYDFSVIASMITLKYAFHQPTYRQQDWFAQCGWFPSRSTINDMLNHSVPVIQPLVSQMWQQVLRQSIVLLDETRVLLLTRNSLSEEQQAQLNRRGKSKKPPEEDEPPEQNKGGSATSYAWLFAGLDEGAPYNLFHWSLTRSHSVVDERLREFQGTVVADAYEAYTHIEQRSAGRISHASCNWHARREFVKAEVYEPVLCAQIISLYQRLYAIEQRAKTWTASERRGLRQREAQPIWHEIEQWLESKPVQRAALPSSRFGKAVGYLKNQKAALQKYLFDGCLPIDNDQAEQLIRPLAVGRRNWLFLGHPQAAAGRMQLLSVVSSAHRHNLIVEDYLTDVLRQLADAQQNHPEDLEVGSEYLLRLLPDRWAAANPNSIRKGRVKEKNDVAEAKRVRRARQRLQALKQKRVAGRG